MAKKKSKSKPARTRYNAEKRWITNKERKIEKQAQKEAKKKAKLEARKNSEKALTN